MRVLMCLCLPAVVACNPADVKDRALQFPSTDQFDDGQFGNFMAGKITVNAAARDNVGEWEVEMTTSFIYQEGDPPQGEVAIATGFLEEKASASFSEGSGSAVWENPPFGACDSPGFSALEDGGCELGLLIVVGVDRSASYTADLGVKGWLGDGSGADSDALTATVELDVAEPE